jgi:chemotaxis protein CheD
MHKPVHVIEIFLQPGDLYFGDRDNRIRTVLGSCVSLTFWNPNLLVGGMCHYMLPSRSQERRMSGDLPLDGRYAD